MMSLRLKHPWCFLELHLMQFSIKTTLGQQLFMRADLFDLAFIQHDDLVSFPDGGEPVSDHDGASAGDQFVDCLLDEQFRFRIYRRGRFVQYEYGTIV